MDVAAAERPLLPPSDDDDRVAGADLGALPFCLKWSIAFVRAAFAVGKRPPLIPLDVTVRSTERWVDESPESHAVSAPPPPPLPIVHAPPWLPTCWGAA